MTMIELAGLYGIRGHKDAVVPQNSKRHGKGPDDSNCDTSNAEGASHSGTRCYQGGGQWTF